MSVEKNIVGISKSHINLWIT